MTNIINWLFTISLVGLFICLYVKKRNERKWKDFEEKSIALLKRDEAIYRKRYGDRQASLIMKGEWDALEEILGKKIPH